MGLTAIAKAAALPQTGIDTPTTGDVGPLVPEEVEIMYYQAPWEPNSEGCVSLLPPPSPRTYRPPLLPQPFPHSPPPFRPLPANHPPGRQQSQQRHPARQHLHAPLHPRHLRPAGPGRRLPAHPLQGDADVHGPQRDRQLRHRHGRRHGVHRRRRVPQLCGRERGREGRREWRVELWVSVLESLMWDGASGVLVLWRMGRGCAKVVAAGVDDERDRRCRHESIR